MAGATGTDTIGATLPQALIVELRGPDGKPAVGEVIRFTSVYSALFTTPWCAVAPLERGDHAFFAADTTDARGRAMVSVQLGSIVGTAKVLISAPVYGLTDTARFAINVGQPAQLSLSPANPLLGIGRRVALSVRVNDRGGNQRSASTSYVARESACTVSSDGSVQGQSVGNCWVVARAGGVGDSTHVRVVPPGLFVGVDVQKQSIVKFALDTALAAQVATTVPFPMEAFPSAGALGNTVFRDGVRLTLVRPDGSVVLQFPAASVPSWAAWARLTPDESSVWFTGDGGVYRSALDGERTELMAIGTTPDPSPVARFAVFVLDDQIHLLDLQSRTSRPLGLFGSMPRWSPTGDRFAFLEGGHLAVAQFDGTGVVRLSVDGPYFSPNSGLDWTADGRYLVAFSDGIVIVPVDGSPAIETGVTRYSQVSVVR